MHERQLRGIPINFGSLLCKTSYLELGKFIAFLLALPASLNAMRKGYRHVHITDGRVDHIIYNLQAEKNLHNNNIIVTVLW